jgi:gas vesicle protein
MNNTKKILTAMAAGAAAGLITGILFAPGKGAETRKKIKKQQEKFADDVKNKLHKGKEMIRGIKDNGEQRVRNNADEFAQESV